MVAGMAMAVLTTRAPSNCSADTLPHCAVILSAVAEGTQGNQGEGGLFVFILGFYTPLHIPRLRVAAALFGMIVWWVIPHWGMMSHKRSCSQALASAARLWRGRARRPAATTAAQPRQRWPPHAKISYGDYAGYMVNQFANMGVQMTMEMARAMMAVMIIDAGRGRAASVAGTSRRKAIMAPTLTIAEDAAQPIGGRGKHLNVRAEERRR